MGNSKSSGSELHNLGTLRCPHLEMSEKVCFGVQIVCLMQVMSKRLELRLYGSLRNFGDLPSAQHTDIRTIVKSFQRELSQKGRQFSLSDERIASVDLALKNSSFGSLQGLKDQMRQWYEGADWGAQTVNEWYTEERAIAYHAHNQVSQGILACASARISGHTSPLLLDLGCGSGLSSQTFLSEGFASFVVGIDLSNGMLQTARKESKRSNCDWVLADMSKPLPFKNQVFDGAFSVGVLHYLLQEAEGYDSEERLRCLFFSIRRCVKYCTPIVFQFFPRREDRDAQYIANTARRCGLIAELICDQSYHTQAVRWFLWVYCPNDVRLQAGESKDSDLNESAYKHSASEVVASVSESKQPKLCTIFHPRDVLCGLSLVEYTRSYDLPVPTFSEEHLEWLKNEHIRFARQLIRKLNNSELENSSTIKLVKDTSRKRKAQIETLGSENCDFALARRLRDRYGAHISTEDLRKVSFHELYTILHY